MKRLMLFPVLLAVVSVSGCAPHFTDRWGDKVSIDCPQTRIETGTDKVAFFRQDPDTAVLSGAAPEITTLATIQDYKGSCTPILDQETSGGVDFDLDIDFKTERQRGGGDLESLELPYFITMLTPEDKVIMRKELKTTVNFDNKNDGYSRERHNIHIPVVDQTKAGLYKIVIGYILTPEQRAYNLQPKATGFYGFDAAQDEPLNP